MSEYHSDYKCPFNNLEPCTGQCMAATAVFGYNGDAAMRCYIVDAIFAFERLVNGFVGKSPRDHEGPDTGLIDDLREFVENANWDYDYGD